MDNVSSTVIKFVTVGGEKAAAVIGGVNTAAKTGIKQATMFAASLGQAGGSLGKAAQQATNFMVSIQQMGAIGGIMAAAQIAISTVADHFIKKADEMVEAAERLANSVHDKFLKMKSDSLEAINKQLAAATTEADAASQAFERLANSYLKVSRAKDETAKSSGDVEMSALALEKSRAMRGAKDVKDAALVGTDFDIRIAERNLENIKNSTAAGIDRSKDELSIAKEQARMSSEKVKAARNAVQVAEYELDSFSVGGTKAAPEHEKKLAEAKKAYREAVDASKVKTNEVTAAEERVRQAENARIVAINEATRGLEEARQTQADTVKAQKAEAEAIAERAKIEKRKAEEEARKTAEAERKRAEKERSDLLNGIKSKSRSQFDAAFDLWRDPEAAQRAQDEAKARGEDLKRFNKTVGRYGGKWRIDEAARLMREGDEAGLQERLADWRKSRKFNGQTEQMVLAAAAKQNEHAAERSLAKIETSTGEIKQSLEAIRKAFEGSAA